MVQGDESDEAQRWKSLFDLRDDDIAALARLETLARQSVEAILDQVYARVQEFPEMVALFPDEESVRRARAGQRELLLSLFRGRFDAENVHLCRRIGQIHVATGVEPHHYLLCTSTCMASMLAFRHLPDGQEGHRIIVTLGKVLGMNSSIVLREYHRSWVERMEQRHREIEALNQFAATRTNELLEAWQRLERQNALLETARRAAEAGFQEPEPHRAARELLGILIDALGLEVAEIWLVDAETDRVLLAAHAGLFPAEFLGVRAFPLGEGFPGIAARTGQPVVSNELERDSRFRREATKARGLQFYAATPVRGPTGVVSVIGLASFRTQPWTERESNLVELCGKVLGRRTQRLLLAELRSRG